MAAINFPNSPTIGQTHSVGSTTYEWDGVKWNSSTMLTVTETDPTVPSHVKAITTTDITQWDDAYSWGNHASAGYLTSSNAVTLSGTQTITGAKTFSGGISGDGTGLFNLDAAELNGQLPSFYLDHANFINIPDPTITLTGDMSGSITLTDLEGGFLNATFTGIVDNFEVLDVRDLAGSGGSSTYHPAPNDLPDNRVGAYFGVVNEASWQSSLVVKGWSDTYAAWELIGPCNTTTTNKWYLRSGTTTSWGTAYEVYHEGHKPTPAEIGAATSSHTHSGYIETTPTAGAAQTIVGDLDVDNRAEQTSTLVRVIANDAGTAELRCQGPNSGTGRIYVGQSTTYGGGIEYSGDAVDPGNSGAGADYTALFRVSGGTNESPNRIWTARNGVGNNNWEFRGRVVGMDGYSGSWGSGMGELTGAFVAAIPSDTSAAWVWSAASGSTFRCGFQMYNGGNIARLYVGSSYYIFQSGDFTAQGDITGNSDISLKTNIETIPDAINKIMQIDGITFNDKSNPEGRRRTGVVAQTVEKVMPELVLTDDEGIKSVAYGNAFGLLVEGIKDHQRTIEKQQSEIDELKSLVKQLLESK